MLKLHYLKSCMRAWQLIFTSSLYEVLYQKNKNKSICLRCVVVLASPMFRRLSPHQRMMALRVYVCVTLVLILQMHDAHISRLSFVVEATK
uniref:Predicted protein n=1 Tax=Hordeum vulgare subsp. vulgare TaxID=112509 RepID=F2E496_HORVV|nr:predicted protein [Hordeum vulgare subsp. vulgare]